MGSKEVQALSEELEKKFSALAMQNSTFQTSLNAKIASLEKSANGLNDTLKKIEASVQKLTQDVDLAQTSLKTIGASKADKKEQAAAIKKINNTLVPMRKDIEALAPMRKEVSSLKAEIDTIDKRVNTIDKRIESEMASSWESIKKNDSAIKKIQSERTSQTDELLGKMDVKLEMLLFKIKINRENAIKLAVEDIEKELDQLLKRTKQLENDVERLDPRASKTSKAKPPAKAKTSDSGDIKEQDIE